ncbi:hypothetical protein K9T45_001717, partial [Campylobacter jejuni]|nr:hypothetical protein [Campylobacter jejuni]
NNAAAINAGNSRTGGATIQTFTNEGIIGNGTSKFGITVWGKSNNKSTITNFSNSGTIHSNAGEAIYLGNTNVSTFSNTKTIKSNSGQGVNVSSGTSIENFSNSGTIQSSNYGINVAANANIKTLNNESSGSIIASSANAINFTQGTSTSTFLNKGTIQGGSDTASINMGESDSNGVTIETFTNEGIIGNGTSKFGITVWGSNRSKSTITNFNNSGTIHSNAGEAIYFGNTKVGTFGNSGTIKSDNSYGVNVASGTTIENFNNRGLIQVGSNGVNVASGTSIENFNNSGVINSNNSGIFVRSNIKTLINSGTITTTVDDNVHAGIKLDSGGTIDNIINTGTIQSESFGIAVSYGKFGTLTIKDGGIVRGKASGISVGQWQRLGDLYIDGGKNTKKDTTVSGVYGDDYGIYLETSSSTQKINLSNGGVIQGNISGIKLDSSASLSGDMILSGKGSRVKGRSGAAISNGSGKISGSITIKDGATIGSDSGQAIENSGSGTVTGGITVSGSNTKLEGNIVNTGNASIGSDIKIENGAKVDGGLVNTGNASITGSVQVSSGSSIESITNEGSGSISGSITVDKNSKLDSITNTSTSSSGISGSITNNSDNKLEISNGEGATIGGGIVNNGNADLTISNQGSVGNDDEGNTVTNNGSAKIKIKDWLVSSDKSTGKLRTVVIGGSGKDNVKVENITVDQSDLNLDELNNMNNIISGVNQRNIGDIGTNGGGEISLSYDPRTRKLTTDFNLNASISGATFRSLISTSTRRSTFIDNVMGNSMQSFYLSSSSRAQRIAMSE